VPVIVPPPTRRISGSGRSLNDAPAVTVRKPDSSVTGPAFSATKVTSAPGRLERIWKGPITSRDVNRS
jgi:hypothetical protein